jgi:hypothetical protein
LAVGEVQLSDRPPHRRNGEMTAPNPLRKGSIMLIVSRFRVPASLTLSTSLVTVSGLSGAAAAGAPLPVYLAIVVGTPAVTAAVAALARYLIDDQGENYADETTRINGRIAARSRAGIAA